MPDTSDSQQLPSHTQAAFRSTNAEIFERYNYDLTLQDPEQGPPLADEAIQGWCIPLLIGNS